MNAGGSINRNTAVRVSIDPGRREVSGMVESGGFCVQPTRYRVYFSARFDRPFAAHGTWSGETMRPGSRNVSRRRGGGGYVTFGRRDRRVEARVGDLVRERRRRAREPPESRGRNFRPFGRPRAEPGLVRSGG